MSVDMTPEDVKFEPYFVHSSFGESLPEHEQPLSIADFIKWRNSGNLNVKLPVIRSTLEALEFFVYLLPIVLNDFTKRIPKKATLKMKAQVSFDSSPLIELITVSIFSTRCRKLFSRAFYRRSSTCTRSLK